MQSVRFSDALPPFDPSFDLITIKHGTSYNNANNRSCSNNEMVDMRTV